MGMLDTSGHIDEDAKMMDKPVSSHPPSEEKNLHLYLDQFEDIDKEGHLASIVQSSDDAIISKTLDGIITSWNAAAERIFGYRAAEMIGQSIFKLIPPDRLDEEYQIQERLKRGEKIDHYETRRITSDGRELDVSLTISPLRDKAGNITGASKIARDITRQKQAEDALKKSEEKYRLAVQTAHIGTWSFDPVSLEIALSTECRHAYNLPEDAPVDYNIMLGLVYPDDVSLVRKRLAMAFDPVNNGNYDVEHRITPYHSDTVRWTRVRGKMYFNAAGNPEKLIGTLLDITDERMAKEELERTVIERTRELQKMNEQLMRSNHDLEQFAYIASHDLQEPLRKIQFFIDVMKDQKDKEHSSVYMDKVSGSANRMSLLIRDVLDYSRLGRSEGLFREVDLNQVLREVKTDYERLMVEKGAVVDSGDLPTVKGNHTQLRQLFANLISNSLKFSSAHPEISIMAHLSHEEDGRSYIRLTFSDNGIGFEQQYAERIFMIFQRLHSRTEYSGTGIGLALCRKIVENHHGHIRGESQPGKGSVFTVLLPVAVQDLCP
jgi:PAS domain S-box-containing protein